jgi:hypothetical protein
VVHSGLRLSGVGAKPYMALRYLDLKPQRCVGGQVSRHRVRSAVVVKVSATSSAGIDRPV